VSDVRTAADRDPRPAAQRVRDAAKELFYRQGIRATGVDEVCRAAGATKMSLYRTYPSKDALVEAILREDCAAHECSYDAALDPVRTPRERLWAYIMVGVEALRTPGFRGCPLDLAIVEFPNPGHPVRKVADAQKRAVRERLRRLCAEAGAPDAEALGDGLLLLVEGAFACAPFLSNAEAAKVLEAAADAMIRTRLPAA